MALRSFALITVATSTTPVQVSATRVPVQTVNVHALVGNTGANIYLGSSAMVPSTGVGVYLVVPKGTSQQIGMPNAPAGINAQDLYLCSDTNGDKAIVSATEQ